MDVSTFDDLRSTVHILERRHGVPLICDEVEMSFFSWLSGGTFESNVHDGDVLFDQKEYGEARLCYQRALKKKKDAPPKAVETLEERLDVCMHHLALDRVERAVKHFEAGDGETAMEFLEDAVHIHEGEDVLARVQEVRVQFAAEQARELADEAGEMSEDDLMAIISGTWSIPQAEEYADMPEEFVQGLIAGHDGKFEDAARLLSAAIAEKGECRFPHLELGRIQLGMGNTREAGECFDRFVAAIGDDEDVAEERVAAHTFKARIHIEDEKYEEAEKSLMEAFRAAPESHVPLFNLGVFLRERGELKRSKTSLKNALDVMGSMHPDMRVMREMGLTCLAMENREEAVGYLEACIQQCCHAGTHDQYDPEAAVPLAKLYEEDGKLDKACDMYRHLATGYDSGAHFFYNLESARLLQKLGGDGELVGQYLARAGGLAASEGEKEKLEQIMEQIGTS